MPAMRPWWDWIRNPPPWEPFPPRETAQSPRAPGRDDVQQSPVIAASQEGDTTVIERELERRRSSASRGAPPQQPPTGGIQPPWPGKGGTDKCAWYLSFRYVKHFGIYICAECIDRIAEVLWNHGVDYARAQRVAFAFLYGHEQFHYRVDRGVELLEHSVDVVTGAATSLWLQRWVNTRFNAPGAGLSLLEEACANQQGLARALKELDSDVTSNSRHKRTNQASISRDKSIAEHVLSEMMKASGPGYRNFESVSRRNTASAHDDLMSWFLLLGASGKGTPLGPVAGIHRVIPRQVQKGLLGVDPDVPLYLLRC